MPDAPLIHEPALTPIADLKPHPQNYRTHPEDQIEQLAISIRQHGFYRNVVCARDLTILAGHGIVEAAVLADVVALPVVVLDLDPLEPLALKVLAGDNFLPHLAVDDDRALTELLKGIRDLDDLTGTGFDDLSLAALVMITRPASEIDNIASLDEWGGMPEWGNAPEKFTLRVEFDTEEERDAFIKLTDLTVTYGKTRTVWTARLDGTNGRGDTRHLLFEG